MLAIVPKRASPHEATMAICEATRPARPTNQNHRGAAKSSRAAARINTAAASQSTPMGREMGIFSCAREASPKALAKPITWMRACTVIREVKAMRMSSNLRSGPWPIAAGGPATSANAAAARGLDEHPGIEQRAHGLVRRGLGG